MIPEKLDWPLGPIGLTDQLLNFSLGSLGWTLPFRKFNQNWLNWGGFKGTLPFGVINYPDWGAFKTQKVNHFPLELVAGPIWGVFTGFLETGVTKGGQG